MKWSVSSIAFASAAVSGLSPYIHHHLGPNAQQRDRSSQIVPDGRHRPHPICFEASDAPLHVVEGGGRVPDLPRALLGYAHSPVSLTGRARNDGKFGERARHLPRDENCRCHDEEQRKAEGDGEVLLAARRHAVARRRRHEIQPVPSVSVGIGQPDRGYNLLDLSVTTVIPPRPDAGPDSAAGERVL